MTSLYQFLLSSQDLFTILGMISDTSGAFVFQSLKQNFSGPCKGPLGPDFRNRWESVEEGWSRGRYLTGEEGAGKEAEGFSGLLFLQGGERRKGPVAAECLGRPERQPRDLV